MNGRLQQMSAIKLALLARQLRGKDGESQALRSEPIAIIGIGCRFPGDAVDPDSYWRMLRAGTDAIQEVPADRWAWQQFFDADPAAPGKMTTRWGGFLRAIDGFDAAFFGIAPREALHLDPQQRLFLEVAYEAIEDAGLVREQLAGSRGGVFAASYHSDYAQMIYGARPLIGAHTVTGASHSVLANRLSYLLDLRGPSISVDTACSSSLVALHLACQSLRQDECDFALAGGVSLMITPELSIALSKWGFLAEDGRCKTFDARANGFVRGEGCGAVLLKRLGDALADGDRVLALIRGSAVNQDGRTNVLTAPSGLAQQAVVREALRNAALNADDISYVEAHGTGTALGDPIELEALAAVIGQRSGQRRVAIGSVKTNVGHLEAAAGIAGVIKVVLAMRAQALPPHLHFTAPNPHFDFASSPFHIPMQVEPWPAGDVPRRAGVSSFGFGGTNAHVVLEEAPRLPEQEDARPACEPPLLLPISARSPAALRDLAARYAGRLSGIDIDRVADVCHSASLRRDHLDHRCAVLGASGDEFVAALKAAAHGESVPGLSVGQVLPGERSDVVFVYSGQGPQWWGMGRELLGSQPVFADALAACDEAMRAHVPWRLLDQFKADQEHSRLDQTEFAQPALFALQVGLTALWRHWGVTPSAVVGHSVGEIAAAYAAGVLDLATAARLALLRGRIMQVATGRGRMAAVDIDAAEGERLAAASGGKLSVAAVNAPRSVVLSGHPEALDELLATLSERGIGHKALPVNYAFHSSQMEPMRIELEAAFASLKPSQGGIALYSTVTGERCDGNAMDARYWGRNLRGTVRFAAAVQALGRDGFRMFLELSPHPVLGWGIEATLADKAVLAASLRRGKPERASMLFALGLLYTHGAHLDWGRVQCGGRATSLPHYPWQRSRFWVAVPPTTVVANHCDAVHPLLGRRLDSPALADTVFETALSSQLPAFLGEHCVAGTAIVPATAMLEMALAAARKAGDAAAIRDLVLHRPLRLTAESRRVQLVLRGEGEFDIFSDAVDSHQARWIRHASGRLASVDERPLAVPPAEVRARCSQAVAGETLYRQLASLGLDFGAAFRAIESACFGDDEAVAVIRVTDELGQPPHFHFHPALLDACIQPCTELLRRADREQAGGGVYLPFALDAYDVWAAPGEALWTHLKLRPSAGDGSVRVCDVDVRDGEGGAIASLRGLRLRRTGLMALASTSTPQLYRESWESKPLLGAPAALTGTHWLVQADTEDAATPLIRSLAAAGATAVFQPAGQAGIDSEPSSFSGAIHQVERDAMRLDDGDDLELCARCTRFTGDALALLQARLRSSMPAMPVWLVTRGARCVRDGDVVDAAQAGPWGVARVARLEHPELQLRCIDLDPSARDDFESLVQELQHPAGVDAEVAWRGGNRWVPRLMHATPEAAYATMPRWCLEASSGGGFDGLQRVAASVREPGPGEIEIEVQAAGLNFRDVLNVLDMVPGAAGPLGGECAGVVRRIGAGVTDLAVGDEVMAFARGSFASHVVVRSHHVAPRPPTLTTAEAAAMPVVFLTALYALERLARLRRGERVLIHAAAGGVGLAAVQVAQRIGAQVFATAGSPAKRRFLQRRFGLHHVFDSRSLDFASAIRSATGGEGVDVVLNALSDDFIGASVAALAHGGRFLEMGKRAIWSEQRMRAERPDVSYFPFDLGDAAEADSTLVPNLFAELQSQIAAGLLRPSPVAVFGFGDADKAFRTMAQARHIGKVVIAAEPTRGARIDEHGIYLVTGGFGALGLHVARWLAGRGAKHLVLCGRRAPSAAAAQMIDELRGRGVLVSVEQADVANNSDIAAVLGRMVVCGKPLRGVVHAAGVLDDAVLLEQSDERLQRVIEPKLEGAWQLHRMTRAMPLDFFLLFSAGAAVLGSPGQAGYCAANLALDAFAQARRSVGLPATSIAWGSWSDGGMAASLSQRDADRWRERGVAPLATDDALAVLEGALLGGDASVAALSMDWQRFSSSAAPDVRFERLTAWTRPTTSLPAAPPKLAARIEAALPAERRHVLATFLRGQVKTALGIDAAVELDERRPLKELGLDSLMAVELRNALAAALGKPLPATLLFDFPTLSALGDHLAGLLGLNAAAVQQAAEVAQFAAVAQLSDAEAEALLLAEVGDARE
jgi:acyl transferase domain-containing protein/NAD(P)-dependent dehydrogenase (short-subunit alcohol dehydrogenase family)/acyl carrier protein